MALQVSQPHAPDLFQLHRQLGDALAHAGRGREAAEAYLAAAAEMEGVQELELHRLAATQFLITSHIDKGIPLLDAVVRAFGMRMAASPARAIGQFLFWRSVARVFCSMIRNRQRPQIQQPELLRVDGCLSVIQGLGMDVIREHRFLAKSIWLAFRCGEPSGISRALALSAEQRAISGGRNRNQVERLLAKAEALAESSQSQTEAVIVSIIRAMAAFLSGLWREAHQTVFEHRAAVW